ncbi:MAG TPA: hypothetical protein VFV97_12630 [Rhodanobacteraceae bacterium]|nr:hypothetical protein [Rhodanobacteraceae bacterium]
MRRNPAAFAILVGGSIAATLDIVYAIVYSWIRAKVPPITILQSVASGLLGKSAYEGGTATALLGLCTHYAMAFIIAAIFWFASRRLKFMTERAVLAGLLYGICVYFVMNFVVLPLSAFPTQMTYTPVRMAINIVAHMVLFGLPIALATRAASRAS